MSFPASESLEIPILQELSAVGGSENVRFIYGKLIDYFPQITQADLRKNEVWRKLVQRTGKNLDEQGLLTRNRGYWEITDIGRLIIKNEQQDFELIRTDVEILDHSKIQALLIEIGKSLNYYAEKEFEFFDVVWREKENSPRISHVFEVQSKGNIDSAFAKLKRAFDAQRSKPFLIVATERDSRRAKQSLEREFNDLHDVVTVLGFAEVQKLFQNLSSISAILPKLLAK